MPVADLIICMMQLTLGQPGCNRASKRMGCRYPTSYLVKRKSVGPLQILWLNSVFRRSSR